MGMGADLVDDEPAVDTPEWAELYARATARYHEERERADRDAVESTRLWDEFLAVQGEQISEGERSLSNNVQPIFKTSLTKSITTRKKLLP